jgi:hypothetical protein
MSLLPGPRASTRAWPVVLVAALAPFPLLTRERVRSDPCALQYKSPSYDRRVFAELASGFAVPLHRALPYVATPRLVLTMPLDEAYRWNLSGSIAARFGDNVSAATLGARLHRSLFSSSGGIMPGLAIGFGPDLVLAHDGGMDAVGELSVDLTPLMIGARASWGPVRFNDQAFTRPARLETFFAWRIAGWRREHTPLGDYLHQPPPPRRQFRPQVDDAWADDFRNGLKQLSDASTLAYLSLVQQVIIRLGAQFEHESPECDVQLKRLRDARNALAERLQKDADTLRHGADSLTDVRYRSGLEALLREQSEAFATSLDESLAYADEAEAYKPEPIVLGPAMLHAMRCVLDGALSPACVKVRVLP